MTEETSLFEIFYCSVLKQDLPPATVGAIVTQARARNAQHEITGLLVFDGMRFCQHLEGPPEAVKTLMQRIDQDSRHTDVRVVYQGALAARRSITRSQPVTYIFATATQNATQACLPRRLPHDTQLISFRFR